jgi:putative flippase GtrA
MKQIHRKIKKSIFSVLDVFYPLFKRFMPLQTYHYAACGGVNTLLSLSVYFVSYNYILRKQILDLGFIVFKPHIAALFISFLVSLPVGFYLSMFVIFQGSYLRRRIQFFRYFIVIIACMVIDYIGLKILVEYLGWYPTLAKLVNTIFIILFNYFSQRHFSFRVRKEHARV